MCVCVYVAVCAYSDFCVRLTSFECKDIERVLDIVELHDLARGMRTLSIAGGGAYRCRQCVALIKSM